MKLNERQLDLKRGLTQEWIITNGIGGFSSQTVLGINTRKYHGLLVAPLLPPARRFVILSKIDESITFEDGTEEIIYSNMCKNYISEGYKNLKSFEKVYTPKFTYKVNGVVIEKSIAMIHGKNIVTIFYKVNSDKDITIKLAPVMNFRDFHQMSSGAEFNVSQRIDKENKIRIVVNNENSANPIYLYSKEGRYIEHNHDIFRNIFYLEEEKRGFFPEENLFVPGRYEVDIKAGEEKTFTIVCGLEENIEEINGQDVIKEEEKRLKKIVKDSKLVKATDSKTDQEMYRDLVISSDQFVTYRPMLGLHTIIAGFPWFLDWGRDSLIAYEGLLLKTNRFDIAKDVLLMMTRDIKFGLVPNGYSGYDSRPLYNSVDASLLLFEQINKYLEYTGDKKFIKDNLYEILKGVAKKFQEGIDIDDSNIYMDKDYLISAGTENTQLTWMDAKVSGFAVTPRNGKAVEVNSLWYNALKTIENLAKIFKDKETEKEYSSLAKKVKLSFNRKFFDERNKCLFDVLGSNEIRPNQLFSISCTYPVLTMTTDKPKIMFETVTKQLVTKYGLATLSQRSKKYIAIYEGDSFRRDMSYHQGITWPWLAGLYMDAFKNLIKNEKAVTKKKKLIKEYNEQLEKYKKTFKTALGEGCPGSVAELYNSKPPYLPGGTFSQAWSVSEVLKIMLSEEL